MITNYFITRFLENNFIKMINITKPKSILEYIYKTDITSIYTMHYFTKDFEGNKKNDFIVTVEDKIYQKTNLKSVKQLKSFLLLYFPQKINIKN